MLNKKNAPIDNEPLFFSLFNSDMSYQWRRGVSSGLFGLSGLPPYFRSRIGNDFALESDTEFIRRKRSNEDGPPLISGETWAPFLQFKGILIPQIIAV